MTSTSGAPSLLILIRHAEKVGDPADDGDSGPHLSVRGAARATALVSLFDAGGELSCHVDADHPGQFACRYDEPTGGGAHRFPRPHRLLAARASSHSNRPVETITPLAQALALEIHHGHADADYAAVAHAVTTEPAKYGGKVVVIAWHHGKLPDLALALGVPAAQVTAVLDGQSTWPAEVFDWLWRVTWSDTGTPTLTRGYQQLLFGDS